MLNNKTPFCFLNVYKPKGITSFDVIYKLRKHLNIKKIGHSGTLDPLADGVMQVGIGKALKLLEYLPQDKEYIAEVRFGYTTSTLDLEGEIIKSAPAVFSENDLIKVLEIFTGEITQVPPIYSAIKVDGKRLYEIARKNENTDIKIPERKVNIKKLELLQFKKNSSDEITAQILVSCSKGTYIRTLALDIAKKLNTASYLTKLTRTKAGSFDIKNSVEIEKVNLNSDSINPKDALELPIYKISDLEYNLIKNGVAIKSANNNLPENTPIILEYNTHLVSIAILSDNKIKVMKNFC